MRGITTSTETALAFRNVSKLYDTFAAGSRFALRDVTFDLSAGRRVAIVGRSGSGKSTLLHLAAGIDVPTTGAVEVHGRDLATLTERERTLRRRDEIGLVFQFFYLLPHLSVWENVALPELIAGNRRQRFDPRLQHLLERVGLADRAHDSVQRLSGGEMQRVAICRALLRKPRLLLADEPTGNLDDVNAGLVMELMIQLAAEEGSTLAYVTHSDEAAALADDIWHLHSGELEIR
jgi:ABC-type lipoprotein export system ATPase subunit